VTRIIYIYTTKFPAALAALESQAPAGVEVEPMPALAVERTAFYDHLAQIWRDGGDVLVVEQSVVIACGTVDALEACPEQWCSCGGEDWPGLPDAPWSKAFLQCNRWRGDLMRAHPNVFDGIHPVNRHWAFLDRALLPNIPAVTHVHSERSTAHEKERLASLPRAADRRAFFTIWAGHIHGTATSLAATSDACEHRDRAAAVRLMLTEPAPASVSHLAQRIATEWQQQPSDATGKSEVPLDLAAADKIATALDLAYMDALAATAATNPSAPGPACEASRSRSR
jgi:hypothetical protein